MADLIAHFVVCFILSLFGWYGASFALGLGIGKEYGDSLNPSNRWDWSDIKADILGIITGLIINLIITWFK